MFIFFFKQKTAYEMRISDWSSDVCSSDLDLALVLLATLGDRQQRQIVVSQHADRIGAQRVHQAQRFQRLAAAVDQVAAEPQPVARRVEGDPVEQALRRFETTQIGRAHVCTPVTNAQLVCRLLLAKKKRKISLSSQA